MNNIFKLFLCVSFIFLFSCVNGKTGSKQEAEQETEQDYQAKNEVLNFIKEINNNCPIKYDMFTCQSAKLHDNDLVISYTLDDNLGFLEFIKKNPEKIKRFGGSLVFSENQKFL